MNTTPSHIAPSTRPLTPAWAVSLVVHLLAIAALAYNVQSWPRGGLPNGGHSLSIYLNSSGDSNGGGNGDNEAATATPLPEPTPPARLAELELQPPTPLDALPNPYTLRDQPVKLASTAPSTSTPARATASGAGRGHGSGSGNGNGHGHGDATVSVFGVEGHGTKFVYLFDRSASMEGPLLAAAKRQLLQSLGALDNVHQFQIVFFNTRSFPFDSGLSTGHRNAFATPRNKQLAANFVGGITADGGTDRMAALRDAIQMSPDVVFFLTDADDPMSTTELAEIARLNQRAHTAICVIEFGRGESPAPDNFLMQLAHNSGGEYGYINTATLTR